MAGMLIARNVAPANPDKVYVPRLLGTASVDIMRLHALSAPSTLRSLESAEAAGYQHTIRKRSSFDSYPSTGELQYFT